MTPRTERIAAELLTYRQSIEAGVDVGIYSLAAELLAIADDRQLLSLGDVSKRIGRAPTTIKTWLLDRQITSRKPPRPAPTFPEPAYITGQGMLWDADLVDAWMIEHPEQIRQIPEAKLPISVLE